MKLNQMPDGFLPLSGASAKTSIAAQTAQATASVRRGRNEPEQPATVSEVSRGVGVQTREVKPGLIETEFFNRR